MQLDPGFVTAIIGGAALSPHDAAAIVRIAYIVAELDFDADIDESETLRSITASLAPFHPEEAEPIPLGPLPIDDEERQALARSLAAELTTSAATELAYAAAYLVSASNIQLDPLESAFLEELRVDLGITPERAADVAALAARRVTPDLDAALAEPRSSSRR